MQQVKVGSRTRANWLINRTMEQLDAGEQCSWIVVRSGGKGALEACKAIAAACGDDSPVRFARYRTDPGEYVWSWSPTGAVERQEAVTYWTRAEPERYELVVTDEGELVGVPARP